jgi:hypothetical protein
MPQPTIGPTSTPEPVKHINLVWDEEDDLAIEWFASPRVAPAPIRAYVFRLRTDVLSPDMTIIDCQAVDAIMKSQQESITDYRNSRCLDGFILQIDANAANTSFISIFKSIEIPVLAAE